MAKEPLEAPRLQVTQLCQSIRETAGLRQQDIGDRLGVKKGTISAWESGHSWPRDRANTFMQAYADVAGITIATLWQHALDLWRGEIKSAPSATTIDKALQHLRNNAV